MGHHEAPPDPPAPHRAGPELEATSTTPTWVEAGSGPGAPPGTASEVRVSVAVGMYIRWRKAVMLADALQDSVHREAAHLTEAERGVYAAQTAAWDDQQEARRT